MKNKYIIFIDGTKYLMNDTYDKTYKFYYKLGFSLPKNNLNDFYDDFSKWYDSFINNYPEQISEDNFQTTTNIINEFLKTKNYDKFFETMKDFVAIGLKHNIKVVRSRDYNLLKTNINSKKHLDAFYLNSLLSIYHNSLVAIEQKNNDNYSIEKILCDENAKEEAINAELEEADPVEYFDPKTYVLNQFTNILTIINNFSLKSSNKKIYNYNKFTQLDYDFINLWAKLIFKLYYDKYERVREASRIITESIINKKYDYNAETNFDE